MHALSIDDDDNSMMQNNKLIESEESVYPKWFIWCGFWTEVAHFYFFLVCAACASQRPIYAIGIRFHSHVCAMMGFETRIWLAAMRMSKSIWILLFAEHIFSVVAWRSFDMTDTDHNGTNPLCVNRKMYNIRIDIRIRRCGPFPVLHIFWMGDTYQLRDMNHYEATLYTSMCFHIAITLLAIVVALQNWHWLIFMLK